MINFLEGYIKEINGNKVIFMAENSNFGIEVVLCQKNFKINDKFAIYIKTYLFDNEFLSYGFVSLLEKNLFEKLITVQGVGPKTAINILCNVDSTYLVNSIISKNVDALEKISCIKSKAGKIVAELWNKFKKSDFSIYEYENIFNALIKIGYEENKIFPILSSLEKNLPENIAFSKALERLNND